MISQIVLASNNAGKLAEFERLLSPLSIQVHAQSSFAVPDCDEPFNTFIENALRKARHTAAHTGLPALADDSGICVPALGGAPGVYSARYAARAGRAQIEGMSTDANNNAQLMDDLKELSDKSAYYYCVLVLVRHAEDPQPIICDGQWWGQIIQTPVGEHGFGYDPHFYLPEFNLTAAQMDKPQKNALSHRGKAVQELIKKLQSEPL